MTAFTYWLGRVLILLAIVWAVIAILLMTAGDEQSNASDWEPWVIGLLLFGNILVYISNRLSLKGAIFTARVTKIQRNYFARSRDIFFLTDSDGKE